MKKRNIWVVSFAVLLCIAMLPIQALCAGATVREGSEGADVRKLQQQLNILGYSLTVDGNFGKMTESAVTRFQKANSLQADGIVGDKTWAALQKAVEQIQTASDITLPVKMGQRGASVKSVQQALIAAGYKLTADGIFGQDTRACVRSYQQSAGLDVDGIVGAKTWNALLSGKGGVTASQPKNALPLRIGSQNEDVRTVQKALKTLGYSLSVDGSYGPITQACVKKFQAEYHLDNDGIVGKQTWNKLMQAVSGAAGHGGTGGTGQPVGSNAVISYTESRFPITAQSDAKDIRLVQQALLDEGYEVNVTGALTAVTTNAVKEFQTDKGILADGVIGLATWEALVATELDRETVDMLAKLVSKEAAHNNEADQMGVARVVINYAALSNRSVIDEIKSGRYTVTDNWERFMETQPKAMVVNSVKMVYYGGINPFGSLEPYYFHAPSFTPAEGSWWYKNPYIGKTGDNVFYGRK